MTRCENTGRRILWNVRVMSQWFARVHEDTKTPTCNLHVTSANLCAVYPMSVVVPHHQEIQVEDFTRDSLINSYKAKYDIYIEYIPLTTHSPSPIVLIL